MRLLSILLILSLLSASQALAQDIKPAAEQDSLIIESERDTVLIQSYATRYNPRKALLYAAVVPGLGQIYNKKYWKLPLVYGGFIAIGYGIHFYQDIYATYKDQLFENLEMGKGENDLHEASGYTTAQLRSIVDRSRRERDFMVVLMGAMYVLQLVDAHVDAHLKEFDLNPNLQVSIQPTVQQDVLTGRTSGVSLVFKF